MNDERWRAFCLHLEEGWKGEMSEQRRGVYATFLKGMDFDVVMAALRVLALQGSPWLPTVPELVAACRAVSEPTQLSWTEAWALIEIAMKNNRVPDGADPVVKGFIDREGLGRLRMAPFYDPDRGEMRIHQLKVRFEEFRDTFQARERQRQALGTPAAGELDQAAAQRLLETSGPGFPD